MCIEISYFCDAAKILNSTDFMFLCTLVCIYMHIYIVTSVCIHVYIYIHKCMLIKRRDALNKKKNVEKQRVANDMSMKNK